jgi:hypothetical protein
LNLCNIELISVDLLKFVVGEGKSGGSSVGLSSRAGGGEGREGVFEGFRKMTSSWSLLRSFLFLFSFVSFVSFGQLEFLCLNQIAVKTE